MINKSWLVVAIFLLATTANASEISSWLGSYCNSIVKPAVSLLIFFHGVMTVLRNVYEAKKRNNYLQFAEAVVEPMLQVLVLNALVYLIPEIVPKLIGSGPFCSVTAPPPPPPPPTP